MNSQISLAIPILALSKEAILLSLAKEFGTRYSVAGKVFLDNQTKEYCLIDISKFRNRDRIIEYYQLRELDLYVDHLKSCSHIITLTSYKLGYATCCRMAQYASTFLELGGTIIISSAEVIRDKDKWLNLYSSKDMFDIYSLYVTLTEGEDYYHSCGMFNFSKAEVSLDLTEDRGLANYVMNVFNYYRLTESVILKDGQTFQPDFECPSYQIRWKETTEQKSSLGRWHLSRADSSSDLDISYELN